MPAPKSARTTIIFNPAAGAGRARRNRALLERGLRALPGEVAIVETEGRGHATDLAHRAHLAGSATVIAAGGDGTAHEAIQGLLSASLERSEAGSSTSTPCFAYVPMGTGCDFAIALDLPRDPLALLERLAHGRDIRVDVGVAELTGRGGPTTRFFINAANIGLGPTVADRVRDSRWLRRWGKPAYILAALMALPRARPRRLRWLSDDGSGGEGRVFHMSVCNGPSFGGGLRPRPDASLTSGRLHVAVAADMTYLEVARQMPRLMRGSRLHHPKIRLFDCQWLELSGADIRVETDGEVGGGLPARLSVRAGGLRVRVPA